MRKLLIALGLAGSLASVVALNWAWGTTTPQTLVGNVNYTMLITDQTLVPIVALTANRTWTLPSAGATGITGAMNIIDSQGNVGGSNACIVIAPASGETINGSASSQTFCTTYGRVTIFPMTGTNWQLSVIGGAEGQTPGTNTNDNALAGNVGEVATTNVPLGSAVQITTNSSQQLASLSLTAGDWDCRSTMSEAISNTTTVTQLSATVGTNNSVLGTQGTDGVNTVIPASAIGGRGVDLKLGPVRQSLAATTTIFLVGGATFATSQLWGFGSITCRRAR
jgi:hypothetical protein